MELEMSMASRCSKTQCRARVSHCLDTRLQFDSDFVSVCNWSIIKSWISPGRCGVRLVVVVVIMKGPALRSDRSGNLLHNRFSIQDTHQSSEPTASRSSLFIQAHEAELIRRHRAKLAAQALGMLRWSRNRCFQWAKEIRRWGGDHGMASGNISKHEEERQASLSHRTGHLESHIVALISFDCALVSYRRIEGDSTPFQVAAPVNANIDRLRKLGHEEGKNGALRHVDANDLKVSTSQSPAHNVVNPCVFAAQRPGSCGA